LKGLLALNLFFSSLVGLLVAVPAATLGVAAATAASVLLSDETSIETALGVCEWLYKYIHAYMQARFTSGAGVLMLDELALLVAMLGLEASTGFSAA
jgi:hypothetical protein